MSSLWDCCKGHCALRTAVPFAVVNMPDPFHGWGWRTNIWEVPSKNLKTASDRWAVFEHCHRKLCGNPSVSISLSLLGTLRL